MWSDDRELQAALTSFQERAAARSVATAAQMVFQSAAAVLQGDDVRVLNVQRGGRFF